MKHPAPYLGALLLASSAAAAQSAPDHTPPAPLPPPAAATAPASAAPAIPPAPAPPASASPTPAPSTSTSSAPDPTASPTANPSSQPPSNAQHPFELTASTAPALADLPLATSASPPVTPSLDLWLGFREQIVSGDGFDPFSANDALPAFHAGASAGVYGFDSGQVAIAANADFGGSSASLRGQATDLGVMRFGAGPELRFPFLERLYVFGRLAPQALHVSTELDDSGSGMKFANEQWTFALDAALGASFRFAAADPGGLRHPIGFFVRVEAGYLWSPALDLKLPPSGDAPLRTAPIALNELALSGVSFGAALGVGY